MRRATPWLWVGLVGVANVALLGFGYAPEGRVDALPVVMAFTSTSVAALGTIITIHRPGNRVAWLLHATAAVIVLALWGSLVAEASEPPVPSTAIDAVAIVVYNTSTATALYPMFLVLFIFPTGHFLSRRWTWAAWLAGGFTVAMFLVSAFSAELGKMYDPNGELWTIPNQIGFLPPEVGEAMVSQSVTVMVALAVGGVAAMVTRRRRSDVVIRQQIKWVVAAAAVSGVSVLATTLSSGNEVAYLIPLIVALNVIPIAITVAITRYQLFEIDRIISRTIAYAIVVTLLTGAFVAAVATVTALLPARDSLAVASATLVVAALFNPLRKRVQRVIDRRFNRSAYRIEAVARHLAGELQRPQTVGEIAGLWKETVDATLEPVISGVWVDTR